MFQLRTPLLLAGVIAVSSVAGAQRISDISRPADIRQPAIVVTIENRAPAGGTFQTPVWVGFHDGGFDSYDLGMMAGALPQPGSVAIERLAEDGASGFLATDFNAWVPTGVERTVTSNDPNLPPLAPGARVSRLLPIDRRQNSYFSYASMVLPSNDAFVANGAPMAHPMFDSRGQFIARSFVVGGNQVNDAGTEENDEVGSNTAFLAQMAPNTGVTTTDAVALHAGYLPAGTGGVLDDPRFPNANFLVRGYETLAFSFKLVDRMGNFESMSMIAPSPTTPAGTNPTGTGLGLVRLIGSRDQVRLRIDATRLSGLIVAARVHVGPMGSDGAMVLDLISAITHPSPSSVAIRYNAASADITGPLAGEVDPIGALLSELVSGDLYFELEMTSGALLRGQLQ